MWMFRFNDLNIGENLTEVTSSGKIIIKRYKVVNICANDETAARAKKDKDGNFYIDKDHTVEAVFPLNQDWRLNA